MAGAYQVIVEGFPDLADFAQAPARVAQAARTAVNQTVRRTQVSAARQMRDQADFPARYLTGEQGRLKITKFAKGDDLEGVITGRHRPTSLARFITGNVKKKGATVAVKPGVRRAIPRAFLIKLRAGDANIDTKFNLGLALRLRAGEKVRNKKVMVPIGGNLYLLYGPSVDQVFKDVAKDVSPEALSFMEKEFLRLLRVF